MRVSSSFVAAVALGISLCSVAYGQESLQLQTKLPEQSAVTPGSLACRAIASATIRQGGWEDIKAGIIRAEVSRSDQKLAIQVEGETLRLMTTTSVEAGDTQAARFQILANTDSLLMAVLGGEGAPLSSPSLSSFVLNKENGLAVWTKSRAWFIAYQVPDTQSYYLLCR